MSAIGDNISFYRKKHGLTQEQLANKVFVTRTTISKWEQGKSEPNLETLKLLSKEFNCTIDELLKEVKNREELAEVKNQEEQVIQKVVKDEKIPSLSFEDVVRRYNKIPKQKKVNKLIFAAVSTVLIVGAAIGLSIGNKIALVDYYANITSFLCPTDVQDSGSNTSSSSTRGIELVRQIEREGSVLVKNENNTLPLTGTNKVNVFGYNSVDWYHSGSGSGHVGPDEHRMDICQALGKYGVQYNESLYKYYTDYRAPTGGNSPSTLNYICEQVCVLVEPELTSSLKDEAKAYSDTAIVCLGRKGGETEDLPRSQYKYEGNPDHSKHYLQASDEEIELLTWVGKNFENVVVLINNTNAMQLDFMDTIEGLDSCLIVGPTGNYGPMGVCDVLFGDYVPSGHLTDTLPRDFKHNITYYTAAYEMTGQYQNASSRAWPYNRNYKRGQEKTVFYTDYREGIYVGYKWFETADSVGYWEDYGGYDSVVQYPFGYGLSYTTFDWELVESSLENGGTITSNKDSINLKVKVTNSGEYAGKDVVQVYLTAPYYTGEIEKSHVTLVGYGKTQTLNPGESQILDIKVDVSDFESYDCYDMNKNGHKGYELDKGEYQLKLMTDSHNLKQMENNVLKYNIESTINIDEDEYTGKTVKNLFTGEDAVDGFSVDGSDSNQNVEYISRANFPKLLTQKPADRNWNSIFEISPNSECNNTYSVEMASKWDNATGKDAFGNDIPTTKPTWGSGSGSNKVYDNGAITELGLQLADPANWNNTELWEKILSQVSFQEALDIINTPSFANSKGVPSAGKPDCTDADGAQQIGGTGGMAGTTGTAYPSPTVTAQTWSTYLCYTMGKSYGIDMQNVNRDGTYAFVANIHRTPFGGRNFENFSEDPYLCGKMAAASCKGVSVTGKYCYMKHFAVNDQEFHRVGLYTWLSEQALRETYLKPFQECVRNGNMSGVMTSFNRVGATWAGGNEALIQGVLRNEWQYHGMIITDYCESAQLMDQSQAVRAGSNYGMTMNYTTGCATSLPTQQTATARLQWRMRESVKEAIFGYIHPLLINDNFNKNPDDNEEFIVVTPSKKPWVWWVPALYTIDAVVIVGMVYLAWKAWKPLPEIFEEENESEVQ